MAASILSSLTSKVSFSIMNVTSGSIVAPNLKIKSVKMRFNSRNMRHRMEDGSYKVDARIIIPATMEVEAICPDIETQNQINILLNDNMNFYLITSKGVIMNTMMVDNEGINQSPKAISVNPIKLRFKQQLVNGVDPVLAATPLQPADSSVVDRGFAMLSSATATVGNLFTSAVGAL